MKKKKGILGLLIALALLATGCGSEDKSTGSSDREEDEILVQEVSDPHWDNGEDDGSTVELELVSVQRLSEYAKDFFNEPEEVQININLEKVSSGYAGEVKLGFYEYDCYREDCDDREFFENEFYNGEGSRWHDDDVYSDRRVAQYNIWFNKDGTNAFHGFFEDDIGPIIVVVDKVYSLGDGAKPKAGSGSVWFKHFNSPESGHPPTHCWMVSIGPWDCRAWKSGKKVDPTRAILPDNGYIKLGDFEGLDLNKAFFKDEDEDEDEE